MAPAFVTTLTLLLALKHVAAVVVFAAGMTKGCRLLDRERPRPVKGWSLIALVCLFFFLHVRDVAKLL